MSEECVAVWRAIIKGQDVLAQGLIRRVGDGMKTEVWHDNWILRTRSLKPMGRLIETPIQTVADLIDEDTVADLIDEDT
jgi:hypothetical protein